MAFDSIPLALDRLLQQNRDHPFIRFFDVEESWQTLGDVHGRSLAFASALVREGIVPGDRIALLLDNDPEFVIAWFAIARLGCVMVPINTRLRGVLLENLFARIRPRAVITSDEYRDRVPRLDIPVLRVTTDAAHPGWTMFADMLTKQDDLRSVPYPASEQPMSILFSSGTTGVSKGVVLSHGHYLRRSRAFVEGMRVTPNDVLYTCLPLFHNNAPMRAVLAGALANARVAVYKKFSVSRFWHQMKESEITIIPAMLPRMANQLLASVVVPEESAHSVHLVNIGPTPTGWDEFASRFHTRVYSQHYGSTECVPMPPDLAMETRRGSCGKVGSGFECRIVDSSDNDLPIGEVGELLVRCDDPAGMFMRYFDMPEETAYAMRGGWYHTGDALRRDQDGFYYFANRMKDFLRYKGENISAQELEATLESHPEVDGAAVVGVEDNWGEERIAAYLETTNHDVSASDILEYSIQALPDFMVPKWVRVVEKLPRNSLERVEKYRLDECEVIDEATSPS